MILKLLTAVIILLPGIAFSGKTSSEPSTAKTGAVANIKELVKRFPVRYKTAFGYLYLASRKAGRGLKQTHGIWHGTVSKECYLLVPSRRRKELKAVLPKRVGSNATNGFYRCLYGIEITKIKAQYSLRIKGGVIIHR